MLGPFHSLVQAKQDHAAGANNCVACTSTMYRQLHAALDHGGRAVQCATWWEAAVLLSLRLRPWQQARVYSK